MHKIDCTVLVVCYNQANFIEACLKSAFSQQCRFSWEIVICDDASTDDTFQRIRSLSSQSPVPINMIQNPKNLGIKENYKRGINSCKGNYIALLEGDDLWHNPQKLERHIQMLDSNPGYAMTVNSLQYVTGSSIRSKKSLHPENSDVEFLTTELLADKNPIENLSCCVFRKQSFLQVYNDFFTTPGADWLLGLLLSRVGQVVKFNEVLTTYRLHEQGIWSGKSDKEKIDLMVQLLDTYDALFEYQYHSIFKKRKNRIKQKAIARKIGLSDSFLYFLKKVRNKLLK